MRDFVLIAAGLIAGVLIARPKGLIAIAPPVRAPGVKAWRMSKWIKHAGVLRTQGIVGDLSQVKKSSITQQTTEALAKLDEILEAAGLTRAHLIAITIYLADIDRDFDAMNEVYDSYVDPVGLPTRLCVQAKIGHGAKIEIRAEAADIPSSAL
mmetsp:Transcript_44672/g.121722  ORF Transcript_44672/g.121722 Transcript_44672/m.121722 type:complete len:153 (-) Transcript_44672:198-656(-)|eukprot:CAMPEP_0119466614 /NCGR_PEP_ID=MMETSP1344-20130328/1193_1 /TAXON_ID=236787 /ORGANISM="Florenciella parvula, Strain CCMP2471" /LENGTH=152 /DNA_ID=CAMNT_0007498943 /DNA_START=48 /DNA_END=506 /DNA_ORIENTATION=-